MEWAFLRGVFKIIAWCKLCCQRLENNEYVVYGLACCTTETAIAGIFSSVIDFVLTKSNLMGLCTYGNTENGPKTIHFGDLFD